MVVKIDGFRNKYKLTENSNSRDLINIVAKYGKFRCIICNEKTASRFKPKNYVTINNGVEDDVFFINGMF